MERREGTNREKKGCPAPLVSRFSRLDGGCANGVEAAAPLSAISVAERYTEEREEKKVRVPVAWRAWRRTEPKAKGRVSQPCMYSRLSAWAQGQVGALDPIYR